MRQSKKHKQAQQILMVLMNEFKPRNIPQSDLYRIIAKAGYYWNVARQDWQHIQLTLTHIQSAASITGAKDTTSDKYLAILVTGGIIRQAKGGTYKRTKKIDLSGDLGDFRYGR